MVRIDVLISPQMVLGDPSLVCSGDFDGHWWLGPQKKLNTYLVEHTQNQNKLNHVN
jgi:hypothetical protein